MWNHNEERRSEKEERRLPTFRNVCRLPTLRKQSTFKQFGITNLISNGMEKLIVSQHGPVFDFAFGGFFDNVGWRLQLIRPTLWPGSCQRLLNLERRLEEEKDTEHNRFLLGRG